MLIEAVRAGQNDIFALLIRERDQQDETIASQRAEVLAEADFASVHPDPAENLVYPAPAVAEPEAEAKTDTEMAEAGDAMEAGEDASGETADLPEVSEVQQALWDAARANNAEGVKKALADGASVTAENSDGLKKNFLKKIFG